MTDATYGVNAQLRETRISFHPETPDFISDWKYASGWREFPCPTIDTLARWLTQKSVCGSVLRLGIRSRDHFVSADWGALDCDGGYLLEQACNDWCDSVSIIGHTKRSTPEFPRFRIFFMWE